MTITVFFFRFAFLSSQLEDDPADKTTEDEEEAASGDEDEEERSSPGDPDEEVSTATKAKQLAERLKATARRALRDLGRILAISLLALAGRNYITYQYHYTKKAFLQFFQILLTGDMPPLI